jgi:hypothetical protein
MASEREGERKERKCLWLEKETVSFFPLRQSLSTSTLPLLFFRDPALSATMTVSDFFLAVSDAIESGLDALFGSALAEARA